MSDTSRRGILGLLGIATVVTLVVTLVRLYGEREGWDPTWFPTEAGGALSGLSIVWLVPVFGFLFGRRLAKDRRPSLSHAFFVPLFGTLALCAGVGWIGWRLKGEELVAATTWIAYAAPVLALLALIAWPNAFLLNLLYALLARAPVAILVHYDIANGWNTHYGKLHPAMPPMGAAEREHLLLLAQAALWVPFTVLVGGVFAAVGAMTVRPKE